jgi:hypothetical protein
VQLFTEFVFILYFHIDLSLTTITTTTKGYTDFKLILIYFKDQIFNLYVKKKRIKKYLKFANFID